MEFIYENSSMIKFSILRNISLLRNLPPFLFFLYLLKYIFNINHVIANSSLFKIPFPPFATIVPSHIILQNRIAGCNLKWKSVYCLLSLICSLFVCMQRGRVGCLWRERKPLATLVVYVRNILTGRSFGYIFFSFYKES